LFAVIQAEILMDMFTTLALSLQMHSMAHYTAPPPEGWGVRSMSTTTFHQVRLHYLRIRKLRAVVSANFVHSCLSETLNITHHVITKHKRFLPPSHLRTGTKTIYGAPDSQMQMYMFVSWVLKGSVIRYGTQNHSTALQSMLWRASVLEIWASLPLMAISNISSTFIRLAPASIATPLWILSL
jgi:hypothetical protein